MDARVKPAHDEGAYAAGLIRTYTSRGLAVYGADVTSTCAPACA